MDLCHYENAVVCCEVYQKSSIFGTMTLFAEFGRVPLRNKIYKNYRKI